MNIKRWTSSNKSIKIKLDKLQQIYNKHNSNGGDNMATATFNKVITLNSISAERLINKIESDKNKQFKFQEIDVQNELKASIQSLKRLLSR